MAYIGPAPNPGQNREVDDISSGFNGGTASFTLQVNGQNVSPGSSNNIIVSLGGVIQNPGTDYTIAGSTITFTTNPASGLSFFGLVLGQQVDIQSVADSASIVSPTLSGPTVTGDLSIADKIVHTGDTNTAIRFSAADTVAIETDGSNRFHITSAGNIGVSTTSPVAQTDSSSNALTPVLDLKGTGSIANESGVLQLTRKDNATQGSMIYNSGDDAGLTMRNTDGNGFGFYNGTTLALRSDSNGKFTALGNKASSNAQELQNTSSTNPEGCYIRFINAAPNTQSRHFIKCSDNVGDKATIDSNGNSRNLNNSYGGFSDISLKENIVDAGSQWDDIKNIKVRVFNFKTDSASDKRIGVVAQEIETVCPKLVDITYDKDEDGEFLETGTKSVKYSVLYMKAIKALQEAITKIETLETKVAALEAA